MSRREKVVTGVGAAILVALIGLIIAGSILTRRIQPYIRDQAEQYLRDRFRANVQIASLRVSLPRLSPMTMIFTKGRGTIATVEGEGIVMRMRDHPDAPPLFGIKKFTTAIDVGALFDATKHVPLVTITGLEINVPPKGERPDLSPADDGVRDVPEPTDETKTPVVIDRVNMQTTTLVSAAEGQNQEAAALRHTRHPTAIGRRPGVAMKYACVLTNADAAG